MRGARAGDLAVGLDNEPAARTQVRFYLYLKYTRTHTIRSLFHELPPPTQLSIRAVLSKD